MYKYRGVGLYTYRLSAPSNAEQASWRHVGAAEPPPSLYADKPHKDEFLVGAMIYSVRVSDTRHSGKSAEQELNVTLIVQNWELLMPKVDPSEDQLYFH